MKRGNVTAVMEAAEVTVEGTFTTPAQTHNPLGPFTTVARWDGGTLTVYDSTQNPFNVRAVLAAAFGLAEENVRVRIALRRRRFRRRAAQLAALDPRRAGRPHRQTAGPAQPHPAADVHPE